MDKITVRTEIMKRRDLLKAAPAAVGLAVSRPLFAEQPAHNVRISSVAYTPADYPIRPQPYTAVTLTDPFWRTKIATNARVTIPFEVEKLSDAIATAQEIADDFVRNNPPFSGGEHDAINCLQRITSISRTAAGSTTPTRTSRAASARFARFEGTLQNKPGGIRRGALR